MKTFREQSKYKEKKSPTLEIWIWPIEINSVEEKFNKYEHSVDNLERSASRVWYCNFQVTVVMETIRKLTEQRERGKQTTTRRIVKRC